MAILHHKEIKIQAVLGRLPKSYTHEQFVEMFIKLYSKDWGKIKSAYVKQAQDRDADTVINMPKPDLYLKQLLEIYLVANPPQAAVEKNVVVQEKPVVAKKVKVASDKKILEMPANEKAEKKPKSIAIKKIAVEEKTSPTKTKSPAKKKLDVEDNAATAIKSKPKSIAVKKVAEKEEASPVKSKSPFKQKLDGEESTSPITVEKKTKAAPKKPAKATKDFDPVEKAKAAVKKKLD